ncbi:hypothetical protein BHUM_02689 [Candidatus Burkholderia humilis]|nr:hypothetical protein BHUM_02689 [Candidatus Burkholderia humilis]
MALKQCRECGTEVSDQAKVCPKCGIKNPVKRMSLMAKFGIGLLVIFFIGSVLPGLLSRDKATTKSAGSESVASASGASDVAPASVTATVSPWHYEQAEDDMQKGTNRFAYVRSTNTF